MFLCIYNSGIYRITQLPHSLPSFFFVTLFPIPSYSLCSAPKEVRKGGGTSWHISVQSCGNSVTVNYKSTRFSSLSLWVCHILLWRVPPTHNFKRHPPPPTHPPTSIVYNVQGGKKYKQNEYKRRRVKCPSYSFWSCADTLRDWPANLAGYTHHMRGLWWWWWCNISDTPLGMRAECAELRKH